MSQKNKQGRNREQAVKAGEIQHADKLTLVTIHNAAALVALAAEWDALSASLPLQVPFTTAGWNLLWWRHLRARRMLIHDRLHTFVLRDAHGRLIAIAPMMISVRPGIAAGGIKVLQFFGADPNITEIRGLICHPDNSDAAIATLQTYLQQHRREWDWVEWQGLSAAQAVRLCSCRIEQPEARAIYYLPLPADWETLKHGLSRNMKEAIRKCSNSLKRNRLCPTFDVVACPHDMAPALETFFRLHTMRARNPGGVSHADVFQDSKCRDFLTACMSAMAPDNARIFQLRVNGEIVATRIGFIHHRQLYLYYSGYDPAWGSYSVMTTLVIHAMQWAIDQGCTCVNLSTGKDYSKQRWQPLESIQHNAIQISPRWRAVFLFKSYHYLRSRPFMRSLSRKK